MKTERLVLIDGSGIAHRALNARRHQAPAPRFFSLLCRFVGELDPSYLAIATDCPREDLVRREQYAGYKANRADPDPEIRKLFSRLWSTCEAMGVAVVGHPRWEADDVMGTLAQLANDDVHAIIVSADKDLGQLINDRIHLYDPTSRSFMTEAKVFDKFGVRPDQIPDYLAIVGDRVDGIPGVKGLGPVAARKLLTRYDSLRGLAEEGVWDGGNAASVGREFENLALFAELTTIQTDLPLDVSPDQLAFDGFNIEAARKKLLKLRAWKTVQASRLVHPYP